MCGGGYKLENYGRARLVKDIKGQDNRIEINKGCKLYDTMIRIRGDKNIIVFEEDCIVGKGCSFWMEGDNISIIIGRGTTFTRDVHFCTQENGMSIKVGQDCMFSNNIIVRTSDSHPIYDVESGKRINAPAKVVIGNHVWIAPNAKIMKGSEIDDNSIIGSDTMVISGKIDSNTLAVGHPAKVVKTNIRWTREALW
jgi:acetyltransferase-like isoleucine patch superfamily enzyme